MKPVFKYALAGLVLAVGSSGAYASVALPSSGNSDLVLFVKDNSNANRVFAVSLGVTVDSLLTNAGVNDTPGDIADLRDGTPINVSLALPTFHSDELQSFMSTSSTAGYSFAILGGDSVGSNFINNPYRYVGTQTVQFDSNNPNTMNNGNIGNSSGIGGNVNDLFNTLSQALGATGTSVSDFTAFNGDGLQGAFNFYGMPFGAGNDGITAAVNTSTHLYMLTSSATGTAGGSTATTRLYQFADVTLDRATGTLTSASVGGPQVPLPAAVWLLGSALVGLGTVRRRRDAQAA